jgi:hypothetical protein
MNLDGEHVTATPRDDVELWNKPRKNMVADEIRQALFEVERIAHAADVPGAILDPDDHGPSRRVREGHDASQHAVGGRQIALELKSLPLRSFENVEQVHELRSIL